MSELTRLTLVAFLIAEAACLISIWIGWHLGPSFGWTRRMAQQMYERKIAAMESFPLNHYKTAVEAGKVGRGAIILTILIALKSLGTLVAGIIAVFWLPFATALLVPGIIDAHDPQQATVARRSFAGVVGVQVSSHAVTAALGFAVTFLAWGPDRTIGDVLAGEGFTVGIALGLSLILAAFAGWREARAHMVDGLLNVSSPS